MSNSLSSSRHHHSLDGAWKFTHERDGQERQATVPLPWQAQFPDLRQVSGRATYTRSFARPENCEGRETVLKFGAVSYFARVLVNGVLVGTHEGGYLPFECVVPHGLLKEANEIEVMCLLPDGDPANSNGHPFAEIPHGKQSWYGPIGGIWQSVTLEVRSLAHIAHCAVDANLATGAITADFEFSAHAKGATLNIIVEDQQGRTICEKSTVVEGTEQTVSLAVDDVLPWSPDTPHLYSLRASLEGEQGQDSAEYPFGFRSIETKDGKILINGKPFYMRAALDQDYYPEGIATPPSIEFLEDQLMKAKALGLNMLRCHIKIPDPRYYEVADRLGMLIWTEIPNVATFTEESARRMRETMEGMLRRDGNHPCIVIWTIINEDWGTRLREDASHRAWLKDTFDWLKKKDPTRLVVDNSPCGNNFHVKTDINDFHYYRSVPERRGEWDALTREFAAGADWTFSPFGDAERQGDEPLIVSEFGVWGLPQPASVQIDGEEPWWMETGATWGDGVAYPHGIQHRFDALGLTTVFGTFENFIEQAQWYQFANVKYQIESMRSHSSIQGYVITEFTDVHWESNGLLDMNRNQRIFHNDFATVNADIVIVPKVEHYAGTAGEAFSFSVAIATGGSALGKSVLTWQCDGGESGSIDISATDPLSTIELDAVTLTLPARDKNCMVRVDLAVVCDGAEIARNQFDISLYCVRQSENLPRVAAQDTQIASYLTDLGYEIAPRDKADVFVTHALDAEDISHLQAGERILVLADGSVETNGNLRIDLADREQPFIPIVGDEIGLPVGSETQLPNINLVERHGSMWRGDWIAGFSWIRREGVFADIPGGPLLDLSFDRIVPHHVMTGFRTWEYSGNVHAGVVVGWVHKPAAFICERRVGLGNMVASTFRVMASEPRVDPVATALLDRLLNLATKAR